MITAKEFKAYKFRLLQKRSGVYQVIRYKTLFGIRYDKKFLHKRFYGISPKFWSYGEYESDTYFNSKEEAQNELQHWTEIKKKGITETQIIKQWEMIPVTSIY